MRFDIRKKDATGSTNDDARALGETGAPAGTVVWALRQETGRGRQGRQWVSPPGNLYCSVLLRPARASGLYAFAAALALGDAVREFLPQAEIELKWPNDVLVGGAKISGILLEAGDGFLIAGMGLNVAHFPENPLYPATSLAAQGVCPPLGDVLNGLLAALGRWAETLEKEGFAPLRAAWLSRARQGEMRVRTGQGEIPGRFAGLDETGHLLLLLPSGETRRFAAGDVFF